jgi:hypothetical protein
MGCAIADGYSASWLIGTWFIVPFVLVAFTSQSLLGWTFNRSLPMALAVGIPVVVLRCLHFATPKRLAMNPSR